MAYNKDTDCEGHTKNGGSQNRSTGRAASQIWTAV